MTRPTFLSLFAGIGGLDLGLERAGWSCLGQVEIDPFCRRVLAKHWPNVPRWGDIREVNPDDLPRADLICGGFPCQPVSTAGKRLGQDDPRWLWPEFARVVRHLRPGWVLVENVPGLLVRGMGDVVGELAACGYDAEWDVLPAAAVGALHLRERVFIVAYPERDRCQRELDEPQRQHDPLGWGEQPQRDGANGHVADPDGEGRHQRAGPRDLGRGQPEPTNGRQPLADANGSGRRQGCRLGWTRPAALRDGWWAAEPDVGRVVARISSGLDGGLDAHPGCLTQARTAGLPDTERLRVLRRHLAAPAASSEPPRCGICGHPLSALPCSGACSPWHLGAGVEEAEGLRCLREGLLGLLAQSGEVLLTRVPDGTWQGERPQAVGSRNDRLRSLGNAVVPQVAELIGRRILEATA